MTIKMVSVFRWLFGFDDVADYLICDDMYHHPKTGAIGPSPLVLVFLVLAVVA